MLSKETVPTFKVFWSDSSRSTRMLQRRPTAHHILNQEIYPQSTKIMSTTQQNMIVLRVTLWRPVRGPNLV